MRNKVWKIVGIVALVALFGVRMYLRKLNDDKQYEQRKLMEDLAREQAKRDMVNYNDLMMEMNDSIAKNLQTQKDKLDSIGKALRANQEKFQATMDSISQK